MTSADGTAARRRQPLVTRLGYRPDARVVIFNADDFGMCHSANAAIMELMLQGLIDSASVMVPCAWAPEALAFAAGTASADVGVHLVLNSEWTRSRWRPLTGVGTSLVDASGFFPQEVREVELGADAGEVIAELEAQLDAALAAGVDVTHLDSHMGAVFGLETGRPFFRQVIDIAARRGLPFRLPRSIEGTGMDLSLAPVFDEFVKAADESGVVILDRHLSHSFELDGEGTADEESYEHVRDGFLSLLRGVGPGVTEVFLHPMADSDELRAVVDYGHRKRGYEHRLFQDPLVAAVLAEEGIVRTGWRALRAVQRG